MLTEPGGELTSIDPTSGQIEHEALLIVESGIKVHAVQHETRLHGGMADALVPVDERMVRDQREAEGRRLLEPARYRDRRRQTSPWAER